MPLAILAFDLPEEDAEHQLALQGLSEQQAAPYQEVREWLFEVCGDEGVDL